MAEERITPESIDTVELLFHWHRYLSIAQLITNKRVLEIGCGEGYGTRILANEAVEVTAVDIDSDAVRHASLVHKRPNCVFEVASALDLPYQNAAFDAVVSFEVLEHLPKDSHDRFLSEIQRVLTPAGLAVISTPDHSRTTEWPPNPYHLGELTAEEFSSLLDRYFLQVQPYFQEINAASMIWKPYNGSSHTQSFAIELTAHGSNPTRLHSQTHLTLLAVCSQSTVQLPAIAGFCVENSRKILRNLWDQVTLSQRTQSSLAEQVQVLQTQLDESLKREAVMKQDNLALARGYQPLQNEIMRRDMDIAHLAEEVSGLRTELDVIYQSRSYKAIKKYWYFMDHSIVGRLFKKRNRTEPEIVKPHEP